MCHRRHVERVWSDLPKRFPQPGDGTRAAVFSVACVVFLIVQITLISLKWHDQVQRPDVVTSQEPYDTFSYGLRVCVPEGAQFCGVLTYQPLTSTPTPTNPVSFIFSFDKYWTSRIDPVQLYNDVSIASGASAAALINMSKPEIFRVASYNGPIEYDIPASNQHFKPVGGSCHYMNADGFLTPLPLPLNAESDEPQPLQDLLLLGYVVFPVQGAGGFNVFNTVGTMDMTLFKLHTSLPSDGTHEEWDQLILSELNQPTRLQYLMTDGLRMSLSEESKRSDVKFDYVQYDFEHSYELFSPRESVHVPLRADGLRYFLNVSEDKVVMGFQIEFAPSSLYFTRFANRASFGFSTWASEIGGTLGIFATLYSLCFPTLQMFPRAFRCRCCDKNVPSSLRGEYGQDLLLGDSATLHELQPRDAQDTNYVPPVS